MLTIFVTKGQSLQLGKLSQFQNSESCCNKKVCDDKSDGNFEKIKYRGFNFDIEKEKHTDIDVECISRVKQNTSNNMHVDDNEPMLDISKSDIFAKSVSENLK